MVESQTFFVEFKVNCAEQSVYSTLKGCLLVQHVAELDTKRH